MPEIEPADPSLITRPPRTPPKTTAKLNYVPFSFEEAPPRLPDKNDYDRFHDANWRKWCDNLDTLQFHALTSNLIDAIVSHGGVRGTYELWFLAEKTGSAVYPMEYEYGGVDDTDGNPREYALMIKESGSGGTNEWTETYADALGRNYKTLYASSGTSPMASASYNSLGQMANQTDADGVTTLFQYDDQGREACTAVDMNGDGAITFNGTDRITWVTNDVITDNGFNVVRRRTYAWSTNNVDASNLVSTVETTVKGLTNWSIQWNGTVGVTNCQVTVYAGGGYRYVTNIAPDNSYTVATFVNGQETASTQYDANGIQVTATTYGYDAHWRQNRMTDARTGTTTSYFNNMDLVDGTVTPVPVSGQSAEVTTNYFDLMGRVIRTTLPDTTSVTNVYSQMGLVVTNCGSRVYPVAYQYDNQGRMTNMTTWTNFNSLNGPATTAWIYDAYRGWMTNKLDNSGNGPSYTYTAAGRLAGRTWARGTTTSYFTNNAGDTAAITYNDSTPTVTNGYDRRGRLVAVTNGPAVCSFLLNNAGEILSESYSGGPLDGMMVSNTFDSLLRRTNLSVFHAGALLFQETNSFDAAGRLKEVSDGTNSATYSYLANSPLVGQIAFAHNGTTQMTATKTYDNLNRLTGIANGNGTLPTVDSRAYTYNPANQRTNAAEVDGSYWVYTYDSLGQVTSGIKHWNDGSVVAGQQFDYTFDSIGNRAQTLSGGDSSGTNLRTNIYANNLLNQITNRTVPGDVDVMGLTLATNTVSVNGTTAYQKYEYFREQVASNNTSAAQWVGITVSAPGQTTVSGHEFVPQTPEQPTYDLDGNLTHDGRWTYTWDGENRLVNMTSLSGGPSGSLLKLDFTYDYRGRRIQKIVSTNSSGTYTAEYTNNFVYDGWNPVVIVNQADALVASFVWGLDLSGSLRGAGGVGGLLEENLVGNGAQFVAYDGNGNVVALVSATNGTATANYEYGPFGEELRASGSVAKLNPIRFSTKFVDDESDLVYYGYRYYNASTGRWLSRDPRHEPGFQSTAHLYHFSGRGVQDINLYGFVENTPVNQVDPFGLSWWISTTPFPGQEGTYGPYAQYVDDGESWVAMVPDFPYSDMQGLQSTDLDFLPVFLPEIPVVKKAFGWAWDALGIGDRKVPMPKCPVPATKPKPTIIKAPDAVFSQKNMAVYDAAKNSFIIGPSTPSLHPIVLETVGIDPTVNPGNYVGGFAYFKDGVLTEFEANSGHFPGTPETVKQAQEAGKAFIGGQ